MPTEPREKRVCAFVDGQNLFYAAKGWRLHETYFYTGVPDIRDDAHWHHFWSAKLASMGKRHIRTFARSLRYRNQTVMLPDGRVTTILIGQEKGIDIRIACAFPVSPTYHNKRGINGTEWIKFDRAMYDTCLDPTDYRG